MNLTLPRVTTGLTTTAVAVAAGVNWSERLGTIRTFDLTGALTDAFAYRITGTLGGENTSFELDLSDGTFIELGADADARITIDPDGSDNSIEWIAVTGRGVLGNLITVAYAAPVALQATTLCTASGYAITVTPGQKARMEIGGTPNPDISGTLLYAGVVSGKAYYSSNGQSRATNHGINAYTELVGSVGEWTINAYSAAAVLLYSAHCSGENAWPDGLTYVATTGTGVPTVTAGISSAVQVANAASDDAATALLAAAVPVSTGLGAVAEITPAQPLAGGESAPVILGVSGKDMEGNDLPGMVSLIGLEVVCLAGSATFDCGGTLPMATRLMTAPSVVSIADGAGLTGYVDGLVTLEGVAGVATEFSITVIGKSA